MRVGENNKFSISKMIGINIIGYKNRDIFVAFLLYFLKIRMGDEIVNSVELKQILLNNGVKELYHANTVFTSKGFFSVGGLLSRGAANDLGIQQTIQKSDDKDKEFGIWYDVFFDSVDVHNRASMRNFYGPITFIFSLDLLDYREISACKITKQNPIYWNRDDIEERYISDMSDFIKGDFGQHIVIREFYNKIPFKSYLKKIILDKPFNIQSWLFDEAMQLVEDSIEKLKLNCQFDIRECSQKCNCKKGYDRCSEEEFMHLFSIKRQKEDIVC